jgi:hypothetical protein
MRMKKFRHQIKTLGDQYKDGYHEDELVAANIYDAELKQQMLEAPAIYKSKLAAYEAARKNKVKVSHRHTYIYIICTYA